MGAQQVKSQNELLILHGDKQRRLTLEPGLRDIATQSPKRKLMNEIHMKTVMSKQSLTLQYGGEGKLSLADFARIKTEPCSAEEYLNNQIELVIEETNHSESLENVKCMNVDNFVSIEKNSEPEVNIYISNNEENCLDLIPTPNASHFLNMSNIEVKKELIESHGVESGLETIRQNDVTLQSNSYYLTISDESSSEKSIEVFSTIKTETSDHLHIGECMKNINVQAHIDKDKDKNKQPSHKPKLVLNPLAFLKKNYNKIKKQHFIGNRKKEHCLNGTLKSEPILFKEESVIVLREEAVQPSIHLNELIIKSENNVVSETNQEIYNNLESSLDVNLSNVDTDFNEDLFTQSIEKVISTDENNTTKYFSIIEISSEENYDIPIQKSQLEINKQNPEKLKSYKSAYIARPKRNLKNVNQESRQKQMKCVFKNVRRKRKSKSIHAKKYTEKDSAYSVGFSKIRILRKLPKSGIKTRKRANKLIARKTSLTNKEEFPRPLKLEPATMHTEEGSIAIKLPKPIKLKSELDVNNKNIKSYLKPQFQPLVRLKRLKSEELLVPLKAQDGRKARKFQSTTNAVKCLNYHQMANGNRRDLHIHQAFSLHPCIKFNRLSVDHHDQSYCNDQPSLCSQLTTDYSNPNDTPIESLAETESKYFSPQKLFSLFHSSTPDGSSIFSGRLDSGISTSTPSISQRSDGNNKTLLLNIAAERAFINYHLMHFGYSQIQFDLYNSLNELNVFLKYLFGSRNTF